MRVATALRFAALSGLLSVPLASAALAFASDNGLTEASQQSTASPYDPNQTLDTTFGIGHPWTAPSDQ